MRVGCIGGGSMGEALVSSWLRKSVVRAADVTVSDVAEARREHLASSYGVTVTSDNTEAVRGADVVLLAVKPQDFSEVAAGLKGKLEGGATAVSIMAGVPMRRIADELGLAAVVRVMPNTAAFVGEAMSVWMASAPVSEDARKAVAALLGAAGREREVSDETYVDMATAVSGSGPGFIFLFLESMIDGAVRIGMAKDVAEEIAVQTLLGSATLARDGEKSPGELREMVTSKGGTTAAGLDVFEEAGLRGTVVRAIEAAYRRSKELSA
ncbi:MAG: pyrroline-5-carboxylate reductase [Dehalococcoidia bacterium]